ncbi:MAG TPA: carboxypeptidase-like regulatory domain-containing protein, partial [Ignavibacteriaceae bacterium]|nr:carboxypeptidase-like regulatory domain-containing protein [Ignavibacteriaceae bacterium]
MNIHSIKKTFLFLILYALSTYGQGNIKGSVLDSLTMNQLKGAEITLRGTSFSAVSNTDGVFFITGIPAGDYIVQTSYLGYEEKKYLINVESGETQILNIELLPIVTTENEMTFTAQAQSQAEEINLTTSSNTVGNIISVQKLQGMPDENIPTALSRLPGVSILLKPYKIPLNTLGSGSSYIEDGEDQTGIVMPPQDNFSFADDPYPKVFIRGLDSKFSNITIDGIRISPTSAKDNSIDLSIFSGSGFQNIELHKTITSDEDADATAGAINMVTGNAPYERTIKAELMGNDNRLDKSANQYGFTGSYGDRFFNNLLGLQVYANLEKKILSSENQNCDDWYSPNVLSYTKATRDRKGVNILLDFITPDGGSIKFKNIYNKVNSGYFENIADSSLLDTHGVPIPTFMPAILTYCDRDIEQKVFLSSIGGGNHLFGFDVDWNAAFSETKTGSPFYYRLNFYFWPTSNHYNLNNSIDSPLKNYCKEQTASIDITKNYNLVNEIKGELKFGGKYRLHSKSFDESLLAESSSLYGNGRFRELMDGSLVMKDFSGTRFDGLVGKHKRNILLSYFQDAPTDGRILFDKFEIPLINEDALRLWRQSNYNEYYFNHPDPDINSYNFSESVFAGYLMHNLTFGRWAKFITGIRIESEHNNYSGYYFSNVLNHAEELYNGISQKTKKNDYDKITILPNFQMVLQPSDFLNLRMAVYKTLIRPDCSARIPKIFDVVGGGSNSGYLNMGNPDLKNADVWNYEFQTQFYGNNIGLFSINAFYKDITGMQQATNAVTLTSVNTFKS